MSPTLVSRLARLLLPCVFALGMVAGCAEDPVGTPLLRGSGPAKTSPTKPGETPAPSGPTSPTGPTTPTDPGAPTLASIAPDAVTLGAAPAEGLDVTLTGSRFAVGAQVDLAGVMLPATVLSPTQLMVHVPNDKTLVGGVFRIMVVAKPGVTSNALTFTVANPTSVAITKLVPDVAVLGATAPIALTITGTGFVPSSLVRFNGASLTTVFSSATQLTATIPAEAFLDAGKYGVTVSSGTNVISLPIGFEVRNPAPQTSAITPRTATAGTASVSLTIDGTGFTKTSAVLASGSPLTTTYVSATRLRATLPTTLLDTARSLAIVVQSPGPGGGTASAQTFSVTAAGGTSSSGGGGASCLYLCDDYGYAPGQCFEDWYCIPSGAYAGCLGQTQCN
jgi:hypothetical protein